jgi:hypothetical protein
MTHLEARPFSAFLRSSFAGSGWFLIWRLRGAEASFQAHFANQKSSIINHQSA